MKIKLITIILSLAVTVAPLVSCGGNEPADTTNGATPDTTPPLVTTAPDPTDLFETPDSYTIKKNDDGMLNFSVTRPVKSENDGYDTATAVKIVSMLADKFGVAPTIETDWEKVQDSEKLEIIVGFTDHPEVAALQAVITYGDYSISAVGNKIILLAYSDVGYSHMFSHFSKLINEKYDENTNAATVNTEEIHKSDRLSEQLAALPYYDGGTHECIYDAGRVTLSTRCYEIISRKTTLKKFDEYLAKLDSLGYKKYTENVVGNNKFVTYTNEKYTFNLGYYDYEKTARLLVEPTNALASLEKDNNTKKVTDSQLTLIGVGTSTVNNGLSVLIRLEDGRFIAIDGAHNNSEVGNNFVKTIKEQSSAYTETPTVAAWIVTHGHADHSGLLNSQYVFLASEGIKVENIILNEISQTEAKRAYEYSATATDKTVYGYGSNDGGNLSHIIDSAAGTFKANLHKAHIGQVYYYSNCKIEIMFTLEGYAPNVCNAHNTTSIITKMTFTDSATGKETTFLSTGDATGFGMEVAKKIFEDELKSDIMTANHHGYFNFGAINELMAACEAVAPALILYPIGNGDYQGVLDYPHNKFVHELESFKESFNAGNRGEYTIVKFPYVPGTVVKILNQ